MGEPFFFQDRGRMALLRDVLLPEWAGRLEPGEPLRLWSAGCGRGEDAYSLAILADQALPGLPVRILGTDAYPGALRKAREGWYSPWSLRELDEATRRRWFRPESGGYRILPDLRDRVEFREHNLLRDPAPPLADRDGFHLILCRRGIIPFPRRKAREVFQGFRRALRPAGALLVGPGEWGLERPEGLEIEIHPLSVVLRKEPLPPEARPSSGRGSAFFSADPWIAAPLLERLAPDPEEAGLRPGRNRKGLRSAPPPPRSAGAEAP